MDEADLAAPARPAFAGTRLQDIAAPGRRWREIRVAELARDPHFVDIADAGA